jgi:ribonuclease P protein component
MRGEQYLKKPGQYALVYKDGESRVDKLLVLKARANGLGLARYGFSVSRRVGGAVIRNRTKRRLREILRQLPLKAGWDLIFIARPPAANAGYSRLKEAVVLLLGQAGVIE